MDEESYMEDKRFQASMYHNLRQHPSSWVEANPEKLLEMILNDEDEWQPVKNQRQQQQQQHGKSNFRLDDDGWMDDLMESLPSELDDASGVDPGFSAKRSKSLGDMETNSNTDDNNSSNSKYNNNNNTNNNNNIVGCASPDNEEFCLSELDVAGNRFSKDSAEFNADLIANQNRNDSEAIQMEIATQQLSKRIKRISIEEFMKVTSMSPCPCPNPTPPTPPPLPQLSPPLILQRTPKNHHCQKNTSIKNTPNASKRSSCHQNATFMPTRQQDKATERSMENTDYPSLPVGKQSATKHHSSCSDSRMKNMEEFNRRLVSSDNWKKALISGVDPKELYFTHHGSVDGKQDIKNVLSECGILEHSKKRNKRGTKIRKSHPSKVDFLQNRNFSSNRSYSPEVLDRMRKALESEGEWDWDQNQPNRNQHQAKSLKKNRKGREEVSSGGHGSNHQRQSKTTQDEEDSYFTTTSVNSSERLFQKSSNQQASGQGVYRSFDGPISSQSDSTFSNNLELNNSRQQTPSSEKVISKHNLPSESDERENLLSAAVLMGKYTQKKQFPLDDMTYNQGSRRVLQYLHGLWLEQTTCDVTIMANGGSILAHKLVLAAWSQTLASLFKQHSSNLDQSQEDPATINMIEYPRDVVADVVNFLYTTDIKLELTNIGVVVAVSRELDISTLVNVCGDFLIKTCEPESILLYYSVAANNELKFALEGLESVIASSISEVADHKYFLNLPYQRIRSILSNARLCGREIDIFQAVVRWVDFNRKERLPKASSLLKMIRFQHMCMNDLAQKVEFASWIFQDKEPKDLLLAAYKFHAMLSSGVTPPGNFKLDKPRCASYNKKKPLVASLNDFRNEYKDKMKACLANQGAFQTLSWEKEELSKLSKVSEEIAGKDWRKAEDTAKDILEDALETSKKETQVDQKISLEDEEVEKSHLLVEEPKDASPKNQSFSNNADVPDTPAVEQTPKKTENQRGLTNLEANLRNLKETFSSSNNSNKSSRKNRLCGEFQF